MHLNLIFGLLVALPALQIAAGKPLTTSAPAHPAASAHANAVAGQADAARIEACANLSNALLAALGKGDFKGATSNFDDRLQGMLDPRALESAWATVGKQLGKLESRGDARNMMYKSMPVIATPLHFEKGGLMAQVVCDKDGKVAGFRVRPLTQAPPSH